MQMKERMKKWISTAVCLCMLLQFAPMAVLAVGDIPSNQNKQYEQIAENEAYDYVPASETVISVADGNILLTGAGSSNSYQIGDSAPVIYMGKLTITGSTTTNTIQIQQGTHDLILDNVSIKASGAPAFSFKPYYGADITVTLRGNNTLQSGSGFAGLQVPHGEALTITAESTGSLTAIGGTYAAGIGGNYEQTGGIVTINGGRITAQGGLGAAGIGGGHDQDGGTVTINGGTITAVGGDYGAGIGGGENGSGNIVNITGGNVLAIGSSDAENIGKGRNGANSGSLSSGSHLASLATVTLTDTPDGTPVTSVIGAKDYGLQGVVTIDNVLYLYLPMGTVPTAVNGTPVMQYQPGFYSDCTHDNATCTYLDPVHHRSICDSCGVKITQVHSSDAEGDRAANCQQPAYCSLCHHEYGAKDSSRHVFDETGVCACGVTIAMTVTISDTIANGTVEADKTKATAGTTVTLTATPDAGYQLESMTVINVTTGEPVPLENNQFIMPASDVIVNAVFSVVQVQAVAIQWPTAGSLTYGQSLSESTLTSEDTNGTFAWQDGTIIPTVNNTGYVVVYTPAEGSAYDYSNTVLAKTIPVTVHKADPVYTVPTGLTATYGDTLAAVPLPAADNGTWSWEKDETTKVGSAGNRTFKAVFTPTDSENYNTVTAEVTIVVEKVVLTDVRKPEITAPEALAAPQTTLDKGANYTAMISWDPEVDTFGFNTAYTANLSLTPGFNYVFDAEIASQIRAEMEAEGWSVWGNEKSMSMQKTFAPTRKAILTVTAKDQSIVYGSEIDESQFDFECEYPGVTVTAVLTASTDRVTETGEITISDVTATDETGVDITDTLDIRTNAGKLVITSNPAQPSWGNIWDWIFNGWWGNQENCDHSYTSEITAPTCTGKGYTTFTCSKCGDRYRDAYTDALGHTWDEGKVTREPTCTRDGIRIRTCEVCSQQNSERIKATGHHYENGICCGCGAEEPSIPSKPGWGSILDWIFGGWWR